MALEIDENNSVLSIYNWTFDAIPLDQLKKWVDKQIENDKKTVTLNLEWGYYNDIDGLDLRAY